MRYLSGIGVPDAPAAWAAVGCTVVDGAVPLANGALLLGREGLELAGADADALEGVPVASGSLRPAVEHPSGAFELDHLVLLTDSLARTSDAVHSVLGLEQRRVRDTGTVRQAFHRFPDPPMGTSRGCIVEVVESPRVDRVSIMGVVLNVHDLHGLADRLGPELLSPPKPAVQRGRHIATVRREVGLGTAVALMTPDARAGHRPSSSARDCR